MVNKMLLIDPKTLMNRYHKLTWENNSDRLKAFDLVMYTPAIQAEPVKHGHWIVRYKTKDGRSIRCSECQMSYWVGYGRDGNYCPECGAKMDGEIEEE